MKLTTLATFLLLVVHGSVAQAAEMPAQFSEQQLEVVRVVVTAAGLIGVPVEVALANVEIETLFRDVRSPSGRCFGPLQVHVSSLGKGETVKHLQRLDWNVAKGLLMLKARLDRAAGDPAVARIMHVCGEDWRSSCSKSTVQRILGKWRPAAAKWKVQKKYSV